MYAFRGSVRSSSGCITNTRAGGWGLQQQEFLTSQSWRQEVQGRSERGQGWFLEASLLVDTIFPVSSHGCPSVYLCLDCLIRTPVL